MNSFCHQVASSGLEHGQNPGAPRRGRPEAPDGGAGGIGAGGRARSGAPPADFKPTLASPDQPPCPGRAPQCIDSVQSAVNARDCGASSVELCASLVDGGTTPSIGMVMAVVDAVGDSVAVQVAPLHCCTPARARRLAHTQLSCLQAIADTQLSCLQAIVRPRGGDFLFSDAEVRCRRPLLVHPGVVYWQSLTLRRTASWCTTSAR